MSELLPCPFDGGAASVKMSGGSDERCGYNFTVSVLCTTCGVKLTEQSGHDKNGWCNETKESVEARAVSAWNRRPGTLDSEDAARWRKLLSLPVVVECEKLCWTYWHDEPRCKSLTERVDAAPAFNGITFVAKEMPSGVLAEASTRHDCVRIVNDEAKDGL